jgi:hypothetical protein
MQRNAILFVAVFAVIFAISTVSALYVCDDSQTILKLGAVENSHVELYNSSLYAFRLCYSDIYGINYTLASPHACIAGNVVAKLAQPTNSHLEAPNGTLFSNIACYGDLSCSLRTGACLANENLILTLAQQTNSHVSFNDTLPFKLCCSSAFALAIPGTNLSFGNVLGFVINSPINGSTYNDFVPISITTGTANSVNYSIDSGTISNYISPTSISLSAGPHTIVVQASNLTAFAQRTIFFNIINTTSTGSSGGSSGSGGGDSSRGVRTGTSTVSQGATDEASSGDNEPLFLESNKSKKVFSLTSLQLLGTILFLLIILILLAILFAHKRKNHSNKSK